MQRLLSAIDSTSSYHPGNSTLGEHCDGGCSGPACLILGVILDVVGSVGINIGQNLQAMSIANGGKECKSTMWLVGLALFLSMTGLALGALSLAPASILVPIESVQFVSNVIFNRVVNKRTITPKMMAGTASIILGVAVVVTFGTNHEAGTACYTEAKLKDYWTETAWWVWLVCCGSIAVLSYVAWRWLRSAVKKLPGHQYLEPIAFAISSAIFGGGQVVVHAKLTAELVEISASTTNNAFAGWFFWMELVILGVFAGYWLFRLTQSLSFYDPLFIIPLMQTCFILFGAISAGIYFKEFDNLSTHWAGAGAMPMYALGLLMAVAGLYLCAPDEMTAPGEQSGESKIPPLPKGTELPHQVADNYTPSVQEEAEKPTSVTTVDDLDDASPISVGSPELPPSPSPLSLA